MRDPFRSYTVWIFSGVSKTLVMITKCTLRLKWYIFTLCIPVSISEHYSVRCGEIGVLC